MSPDSLQPLPFDHPDLRPIFELESIGSGDERRVDVKFASDLQPNRILASTTIMAWASGSVSFFLFGTVGLPVPVWNG